MLETLWRRRSQHGNAAPATIHTSRAARFQPDPSQSPMIRIANGQGFWGDWLEAPVRLVDSGPIDYLALDYLAEVTMSILQKQRQRIPTSATPAISRR